jgi:hypothetical protein
MTTTTKTARIAEVCRRAISGDTEHFSNDIPALRRVAVENVKNTILAKKKLNSVVEEWSAAREAHKKGSLRQ